MSKSEERKLEALVRKTAAKVSKSKPKTRRQFDRTLQDELDEDRARDRFFSEMKKREF
jgi:hypothetical protein